MNVFQHQQLTIIENTKRLAAGKEPLPGNLRHGTTGYVKGCRCGVCLDAHRTQAREWARRKKGTPPEKFRKTKPAPVVPFVPPTRSDFYMPPRRVELPEEPIFALPVELPRPPMSRADVQASVDEGLITDEEALSLAGPPPPVLRLVHAPRTVVPTTGVFKGSCKAVCAETGLKCRLPAHSELEEHANERGKFRRVATPGQTTFARREALDAAAMASNHEDVMGSGTGRDRAALAEYRARWEAKQKGSGARRAHDGATTTTGLEGRKAYEERVKARRTTG